MGIIVTFYPSRLQPIPHLALEINASGINVFFTRPSI
jgi:hypothetical protein